MSALHHPTAKPPFPVRPPSSGRPVGHAARTLRQAVLVEKVLLIALLALLLLGLAMLVVGLFLGLRHAGPVELPSPAPGPPVSAPVAAGTGIPSAARQDPGR